MDKWKFSNQTNVFLHIWERYCGYILKYQIEASHWTKCWLCYDSSHSSVKRGLRKHGFPAMFHRISSDTRFAKTQPYGHALAQTSKPRPPFLLIGFGSHLPILTSILIGWSHMLQSENVLGLLPTRGHLKTMIVFVCILDLYLHVGPFMRSHFGK